MADNKLLGTFIEQRMDNKTEFDEFGKLDIGDPRVMLARYQQWYAEHVRVLTELGIPVSGADVGEGLPPDIDDYDDL